MKKILIDIDDVICKNVYLDVMNKVLGTSKKLEECNTYKIESNFETTDKQLKAYYAGLGKGDIYANAKLIDGCKEVVEKLSHKYEIYICSAVVIGGNLEGSGNLFVEKFDFLCKNFPFIDPNNFIFASNKKMFQADVMIDDKASNLAGSNKKLKLMFTAFHNKNMSKEELDELGIIRVDSWKDVEKILL